MGSAVDVVRSFSILFALDAIKNMNETGEEAESS